MVAPAQIELAIAASEVRLTVRRRRRESWSGVRAFGDAHELERMIVELVGEHPDAFRGEARAELSSPHVVVRRLHGLELVRRASLVYAAVVAEPDRFFVKPDGGTEVALPARTRDGAWCTAGFARTIVDAVERACDKADLRLLTLAPSPETWRDVPLAHRTVAHKTLALTSAYARGNSARRLRVVRRALLGAMCAAIVFVMAAPTVAAARQGRVARSEVRRGYLGTVARNDSLVGELNRVSRALFKIEAFAHSRRSMLRFLTQFATQLPDSSAVISVTADSVGATALVITTSSPRVIERMAALAPAVHTSIGGAMTREFGSTPILERFTLRARFAEPITRGRARE